MCVVVRAQVAAGNPENTNKEQERLRKITRAELKRLAAQDITKLAAGPVVSHLFDIGLLAHWQHHPCQMKLRWDLPTRLAGWLAVLLVGGPI